jgi:hypothetical protein
MKTWFAFLACVLFAAPAFAQDMIDPSTIQIVNAPDFRGWTVAGRFSEIDAQPDGRVTYVVDGQNCDVTPQRCWPVVQAQKGPLQFTIWLFLQINGQWVGSAFIEGINSYNITGNYFDTYARDWYYCCRWNPMTGHVIQEGETIGFMFGGGDNRDSNGPNSGIRSNIVTIQATHGTHTFPKRTTPLDVDGDGRSDIGVFRPSTGQWLGLVSSTNYTSSVAIEWGGAGDIPVPGDYDGDGKMDIVVFRPSTGVWYIIESSTRIGFSYTWGGAGDIPVPGDYDGDGKTDIAVFRPSTGAWYIVLSSTGAGIIYTWGGLGDIPVMGDYDGDGKTDIAVFRPSTGTWYIVQSSTMIGASFAWGGNEDIPVPGDYDGDGKTDIAVFRPSTGVWYIIKSSTGMGLTYTWGGVDDIPMLLGDYDGDGKTDIAVFRPSTGVWYIVLSSTGAGVTYTWGGTGDIPL